MGAGGEGFLRLHFERVVPIVVPSSRPSPEARETVGREEERPPPLALADVGELVHPVEIEGSPVDAQDDVAEGHRPGADEGQAEEPASEATIDLQGARPPSHLPAGHQGEEGGEETERGRGESPGVAPDVAKDLQRGSNAPAPPPGSPAGAGTPQM
jgi:hypothetical protein